MESLPFNTKMMLILTPLPDDLWESLKVKIKGKEDSDSKPLGGRPKSNDRYILAGIVYRMEHDISWKELPPRFGKRSTIHSRYRQWMQDGTLKSCKNIILQYYWDNFGIELDWQILEGKRVKRKSKDLNDTEEVEMSEEIEEE